MERALKFPWTVSKYSNTLFLFLDFLIIICFLCSDYNTSDSEDLFADDAYESENTYDLIDNQEAYNASGNWSLYDNFSDQFVSKESHSDTEMEEGKFWFLF